SELAKYDHALLAKLPEFERQNASQTEWVPLNPTKLVATNKAKLTKDADLAIFASGPNGKGDYVITAETNLRNITGIRLEVLADKRLPQNGPGRAPNGNFVVSEFEVMAGPAKAPQLQPVGLHNARADFSQQDFDVSKAIDGKVAENLNGW